MNVSIRKRSYWKNAFSKTSVSPFIIMPFPSTPSLQPPSTGRFVWQGVEGFVTASGTPGEPAALQTDANKPLFTPGSAAATYPSSWPSSTCVGVQFTSFPSWRADPEISTSEAFCVLPRAPDILPKITSCLIHAQRYPTTTTLEPLRFKWSRQISGWQTQTKRHLVTAFHANP